MNGLKSADNLLHQVALENFVRCNTLENLHTEWESLNPIQQVQERDALEAACRRVDRAGGFTYSAEEVCRLVKIATLSHAERAAIEAGANPDDYLLRQERRLNRMKQAMRLHQEFVDGSPSASLSRGILRFLAARAPDHCCRSVYFKSTLFDEVEHRIRLLTKNASASIPPGTWIAEESKTVNMDFLTLDPSGYPLPPNRVGISLDKLVMQVVKYVMREESCLSITLRALVKVRQLLQRLHTSADARLLWRAKQLDRARFTKLLNERLASQNSLSSKSEALVA